MLRTPLAAHPAEDGFEVVGHDGRRILALAVDELLELPGLASPRPAGEHVDRLARRAGSSTSRAVAIVDALAAHGLLAPAAEVPRARRSPDADRAAVVAAFRAAALAREADEVRRRAAGAPRRTRVVPVSFTLGPPLALGLIAPNLIHGDGGRLTERYDVRCDWEWDPRLLDLHAVEPLVLLGSAYVWSHVQVLEVARAVKARQPGSLVVLGGPDVPKRAEAAEAYLAAHPEVDVLVRGEGEQSAFELLDALGPLDEGAHLAPLAGVDGLTYRCRGRIVRTGDRARMADLGAVPSPFLAGLFDTYAHAPLDQVILESNRGCPYGCTFCDWGSATQSRIRRHELDRVIAELRWCAAAEAEVVSFADANFGIFARDLELAAELARLHAEHGHPRGFGANFAKNTVKHLAPIIRTLVDAGIVNRGLLALQTTDEATLEAVARSNIKVERYDAIAAEMREAGLPFAVELMMGLPGQTAASFRADLQQCVDREVEGTVNPTTVLVNSPMNAPSYREVHRIETASPVGPGQHALVVQTATFTREEYASMRRLRRAFLLCQNFGMTRHLDRLLRQETGLGEIDLLEQRLEAAVDDPDERERYPNLHLLLGQRSDALVPPVSWAELVAELVDHATATYPEASRAAIEVAAEVQLAHLPAFDRHLPERLVLDHDYAAWFAEVVAAKEAGHHRDWPERVPRLATFGPGELLVDDPHGRAASHLGCSVDHGSLLASWEHRSAVSRARFAATATA
ncbi:MAG: radical SAM protein [Acidimicrobiales bacterium]